MRRKIKIRKLGYYYHYFLNFYIAELLSHKLCVVWISFMAANAKLVSAFFGSQCTLWAIKKRDTFIFSITQTNIDQFSLPYTTMNCGIRTC